MTDVPGWAFWVLFVVSILTLFSSGGVEKKVDKLSEELKSKIDDLEEKLSDKLNGMETTLDSIDNKLDEDETFTNPYA